MANPLFDALFAPHIDSPAPFIRVPGGDDLSYAAFTQMSARYAHALKAAGLAPGDRLVVQIAKSPRALAIYAACVQAGVVYLPLNTSYTGDEVAYFLSDSGAALMLCDHEVKAALSAVAHGTGAKLMTQSPGGTGSFDASADGQPSAFDVVERGADDLAALLYTSGTTGRSKGAMLSQDNLLSNAQVLAEYWRFTSDDVLLHALPIFHTHGLFVATNIVLLTGASMIFEPSFNIDKMIEGLPHATTMMGVPTFYTRLLGDTRFTKDLTAHMRLFVSGSAPLLAETHVQFDQTTGHRILERYGMTETNMNTSNPYDGERRAGTVGFALPGVELKITQAETGAQVPQGEVGQIEVRGPNVFQGYWQMPEKTAEELRSDGFFITGDLGMIDADGYVQIVGRNKDLIISGGYNIYPKEIELVLDDQPGVLETAVIGVPHPDFGEAVVAVLIALPGALIDEDGLRAAVQQGLARFKHPRTYHVMDALPRNTMGKVQKNLLRDRFKDSFTG